MRKKIIIISISILLILFLVMWKVNSNYRSQHYYEKLKENMQSDIERVLYIVCPHCEVGSASFSMDFEAEQNDYYGIDKEKILDIDGKSYCKVRVKAKCISDGKLEWNTYIKCKDYEDEGYNIEKQME